MRQPITVPCGPWRRLTKDASRLRRFASFVARDATRKAASELRSKVVSALRGVVVDANSSQVRCGARYLGATAGTVGLTGNSSFQVVTAAVRAATRAVSTSASVAASPDMIDSVRLLSERVAAACEAGCAAEREMLIAMGVADSGDEAQEGRDEVVVEAARAAARQARAAAVQAVEPWPGKYGARRADVLYVLLTRCAPHPAAVMLLKVLGGANSKKS